MPRIKDLAMVGSVAFVVSLIGVLLANQFIEGFSIAVKTVMFIILVGIAMYVAFRMLGEAKKTSEVGFADLLIYGVVLFGIGYLIVKFGIAPEFSIALKSIIP